MKQTELKSALGKIRARDELIASTMERLEAQREKKSRISFASGKALRLASAALACVLFLGVGILMGRRLPGSVAETGQPETYGVSPMRLMPSDTVFSGEPLREADEQDLEDELIIEVAGTEVYTFYIAPEHIYVDETASLPELISFEISVDHVPVEVE